MAYATTATAAAWDKALNTNRAVICEGHTELSKQPTIINSTITSLVSISLSPA